MNKESFIEQLSIQTGVGYEDLLDLYCEQEGKCAFMCIPLTYEAGKLTTMNVDRIDPSQGYVLGNVQLVCQFISTMKLDHSDDDVHEMLEAFYGMRRLNRQWWPKFSTLRPIQFSRRNGNIEHSSSSEEYRSTDYVITELVGVTERCDVVDPTDPANEVWVSCRIQRGFEIIVDFDVDGYFRTYYSGISGQMGRKIDVDVRQSDLKIEDQVIIRRKVVEYLKMLGK